MLKRFWRTRAVPVVIAVLMTSCTITRPVAVAPTPSSLEEYLRGRTRAALRITDSVGRRRWVYDAIVRGDTLRGSRSQTTPRDSIAVPLNQIREIAVSRYSATRTLGFVGGLVALVGLLALLAPDPTY